MVSGTTVLCLFLFVAGCLSQTPFQFSYSGNATTDYALNFTIPPINYADIPSFTLNSAVPAVVCFQEKYQTPVGPQISNESCTEFFNLTAGINSRPLPKFRNFLYYVAVYYAEPPPAGNYTFMTLIFNGTNCSQNLFYDEAAETPVCRPATNASLGLGVTTVTFPEDGVPSTRFFVLTAPDLWGYLSVASVANPEDAEASSDIYIRYSAVPTTTRKDGDNLLGPARFDSPRPGSWVIGIIGHVAGTYSFNVSVLACALNTGLAGPSCNTPYGPAEENMTLVAFPGQYRYWIFNATRGAGLNVSITTEDRQFIPELYVSKGNLPEADNHDIANCNQQACKVVRTIKTEIAATSDWELWFISVTASVTEGNTTYGIWFNETCPSTCTADNRGYCEDEGDNTGVCTCQMDYTGIDCSISHGLGAQYIVLIIIVALVVASAIIGFVAWAYMRRKRVNYELVS